MSGGPAAAAAERLARLFEDGEWISERVLLRARRDRNPFFTANILLLLERSGAGAGLGLTPLMDQARAHLASYRVGHRAYHWPLEAGRSAMHDPAPLWRHRWTEISPDADCTCLVQLARRDSGLDAAIVDDLAFYRADGDRFLLPAFQRGLPGVRGSFLTWFPPRERCRSGKVETVDAGADANILWYLGSIGRLDAPGAAETIRFLVEAARSGLVLREPFRVSMYYPSPAVLLYLISRAAVWGEVAELLALGPLLRSQVADCPARSSLEALCLVAAGRLLGAPGRGRALPAPTGSGAFYVGPLLAWPLQRWAPLLPPAANPATQLKFRSEALEWALTLSLRVDS